MKGPLVYLAVPESLRVQIENSDDSDFRIDPSRPIPVELPCDMEKPDREELARRLSWEMIVSGMIRVCMEEDTPGEDAAYYRRFIRAVRPDILGEFSGAAVFKARNGDFDMALEIIEALQAIYPDEDGGSAAEAMRNLHALVLEERAEKREQSREGSSRQVLRRAAAEVLDDEHFRTSYTLILGGKEKEALESIRAFLEEHPTVWNGWFVLGWALRRLERWEDGAAAFKKALELGGRNADTRNELAICLLETGRLAEARAALEAALREEPENVKIISNLAVVALRSGDKEEAAAFFRIAHELDPDDPLAASNV